MMELRQCAYCGLWLFPTRHHFFNACSVCKKREVRLMVNRMIAQIALDMANEALDRLYEQSALYRISGEYDIR